MSSISSVQGRPTGTPATVRLSSEHVWRQLAKASFAVVSHVTPSGRPRSSGVVYAVADGRLYWSGCCRPTVATRPA